MYVGLKNIEHHLSTYPTHLTFSDDTHCLTGWNKLASAPKPYSSHILYTCEYEPALSEMEFSENMHILCILPDDTDFSQDSLHQIQKIFPEDASILFLKTGNPEPIYTELQQYYNIQSGVGMFGQTLLEHLAFGDSLQDAIEYAYRVLMNPIFVFDTNYNLIAATWESIHRLGIEDDVIKNKGFSNNDYKMANQERFHDRMIKSEVPIKRFNQELGYEQLICSINTQKNLGHIVVSAVNKPLEPIDTEFLLILKKFVNQLLSNDNFIRNAKGFNYEYFLKDLLDEKIKADRVFSERTEYIQNEFVGNLYCMVVESARSMNAINNRQMRNIIESRFPNSKVLIYNGQIVCIFSISGNHLLPKEYRQVAANICKEHGLFAGLSNCFQNILELAEYYNQALRSIELGIRQENTPNLFCYDEHYMEHLTSVFLQKEHQARAFCHPKMQFLMDYDKLHKSELAYTFYMYLIHERNLAATADAMDMHRTSLVYRFKKINSLIGEDFNDYKERMHMILSYEMYQ